MLRHLLSILLPVLLACSSTSSFAIYKCSAGAKITYSEAPCSDGASLKINNPTPSLSDAKKAHRQNELDKRKLKQLETVRHKREAIEEKEQRRADHARIAKHKKCASLAQRKKWSEEDALRASGKSASNARLKADRLSEKYALECGR